MEIKANAKINWYLDVEGERADGYHYIKSVMQPITLCDTIILEQAAQDEITCTDKLLSNTRNLAYQAWQLMKERYKISGGMRIHIIKNIPVTAGLGGGSGDAAAVFRGINEMFGLDIPMRELLELGATLGSDIPFAIQNKPALCTGIGTELHTLGNVPSYDILLLNPNISLSTKLVYQSYQPLPQQHNETRIVEALRNNDLESIGRCLHNALAPAAAALCPKIPDMYNDLKAHGLYASMSGSGPTVFGIGSKMAVEAAYQALKDKYPIVIKTKTL
ncbi:MAG: 4-(cytidine 5'-diphospho)-2-C-methyl-D-erythritol kinase [Firmicutes bacterium]|nr:4-(cytidine 5'-diphospho)-2-C-methyl-D-erythritol kinase [Bacillota bacterium]